MAKYTLLEMVQIVLSSIDGDEVNSVGDSVEAQQVAFVIRSAFDHLATRLNLHEQHSLFNLEATSPSTPTIMTKPSTVDDIDWLRYNKKLITDTVDVWGDVQFKDKFDFITMLQNYDQTASNVGSFTFSLNSFNTTIYYQNDKAPDYWTSFDDNYIVFDSYDVAIDSSLQQSKTSCYGKVNTTFMITDSYVPPLDNDQFDLLLQESKAMAWAEIKQAINTRAEKRVNQGLVRAQKEHDFYIPSYGRHSR